MSPANFCSQTPLSKLYGFFNIRFLFASGARSTLEGTTLVVTFTFPSSSIPLQ